ncbi:MAG TPA: RibD family protein [Candidatus Acidoferrum sp.]|nr:RibD family protein [Candidatus Acidoferrum sp.]
MRPKPKVRGPKPRLPFGLANLAMTADGKIATANRAVSSFGSARDHEHLLELRATADAVLAGARTVDSAPVNLGPGPVRFRKLRRQNGLAEYNLRVVVSGNGSLSPQAEVFRHRFSPVLVLTTERASPANLRRLRATADEVRICGRREIDFREAFAWLREEWGVKRLLCEGGGGLNDALFRAGLIDELHLTICPQIFGGRTAPTIADGTGFGHLTRAFALQFESLRRSGDEAFLVFSRSHRD